MNSTVFIQQKLLPFANWILQNYNNASPAFTIHPTTIHTRINDCDMVIIDKIGQNIIALVMSPASYAFGRPIDFVDINVCAEPGLTLAERIMIAYTVLVVMYIILVRIPIFNPISLFMFSFMIVAVIFGMINRI